MPWTISAFDIDQIIGQNPELADIDNPHGHIVGRVSYLRAEHENGQRRIGRYLGDGNAEQFEGYAKEVNEGLLFGWTPDVTWAIDRPCYGSAAYLAYVPEEIAEEIEADRCPF